MIRFNDRVAVVTGAGRGIGFAYARALAARGAKVVVNDVGVDDTGNGSDPSVAQHAADTIRAEGGIAAASSRSIDRREGCQSLMREAIQTFGRVDILIHNAGWVGYQTIEDMTPDFLARALAIQVEAPIWLAQAAWFEMKQRSYGRIVFTTSDRAIYPEYAQRGLGLTQRPR